MNKLILLLLIVSCGKSTIELEDSTQTVEGIPEEITIIHKVGIPSGEEILETCSLNNTQEEIDQCVDDTLDGLTDLINNFNQEEF
jgi:hypothetical protein